jgi:hypothetical protein
MSWATGRMQAPCSSSPNQTSVGLCALLYHPSSIPVLRTCDELVSEMYFFLFIELKLLGLQ